MRIFKKGQLIRSVLPLYRYRNNQAIMVELGTTVCAPADE
jgi:hypothetical protein